MMGVERGCMKSYINIIILTLLFILIKSGVYGYDCTPLQEIIAPVDGSDIYISFNVESFRDDSLADTDEIRKAELRAKEETIIYNEYIEDKKFSVNSEIKNHDPSRYTIKDSTIAATVNINKPNLKNNVNSIISYNTKKTYESNTGKQSLIKYVNEYEKYYSRLTGRYA